MKQSPKIPGIDRKSGQIHDTAIIDDAAHDKKCFNSGFISLTAEFASSRTTATSRLQEIISKIAKFEVMPYYLWFQ